MIDNRYDSQKNNVRNIRFKIFGKFRNRILIIEFYPCVSFLIIDELRYCKDVNGLFTGDSKSNQPHRYPLGVSVTIKSGDRSDPAIGQISTNKCSKINCQN